jgi:hypothetical protein
MRLAGAVAASVILAFLDWPISAGLGIPTLGVVTVDLLSSHGMFGSIGGRLALQIAIDLVFWFVLICGLCWLFRSRQRKSAKSD